MHHYLHPRVVSSMPRGAYSASVGSGTGARHHDPRLSYSTGSTSSTSSSSSSFTSPATERLRADLLAEKKQLHTTLRAFERSFKQAHGRKVATAGDILPVDEEYRRYKKVKALLEQLGGGGGGGKK